MSELISSIAIAGAWGYIGRKFLDAAAHLQLATSVYDPGPAPEDIDLRNVSICENPRQFYQQQTDLFHLALHPEHRATGLEALLQRSHEELIRILCEKPIAVPEHPEACADTVQQVQQSRAVVLYDFLELFDPMTRRILDFLASHRDVRIESFSMQRSKDREDPTIPRNRKRMVHIQYQESVHCLAFVLYLLARAQGSIAAVFQKGLSVQAESRPYRPPNPEDYTYVVDGMCEFDMVVGDTQVHGRTDFTRGAAWSKRREIKGTADGQPFVIVADYLEGHKQLSINGQAYEQTAMSNTYVEVVETFDRLCQEHTREELMSGVYPNPAFAQVTYQLSSMLWRASWRGRTETAASLPELLAYQADFAAAQASFARYD